MTEKNWFSPESGRFIVAPDEAIPMLTGAIGVLDFLWRHVHSASLAAERLSSAAAIAHLALDDFT